MKLERLAGQLRNGGRRKALVLRVFSQTVDGREGDRIVELEFDGTANATKRSELAAEALEAIQGDCDEAACTREYRGIIYDANDNELHRFGIKQTPDPAAVAARREAIASGSGEEATVSGLLSQSIRHTERAMDLMLSSHEKTHKSMQLIIDMLGKQVTELQSREMQAMELARNALTATGMGPEQERNADRLDKGLDLGFRYLAAFLIQNGLVPKGFGPETDLTKLRPTFLGAANDNATGAPNGDQGGTDGAA